MHSVSWGAAVLVLAACSPQSSAMPSSPAAAVGALDGGPWTAEEVAGAGIPDGARVEMTFEGGEGGTGRVSGRSGCNRFSGSWRQTGGALSLGPLAGTRMACVGDLNQFEDQVLAILAAPLTVSFDASGAATLATAGGQSMRLRRAAH